MTKKKLLLTIACLLALGAIERTYYLQNGGFRLSKLISKQPSVTSHPPAEIDALLDQPFHYVGSGGTSFVFLGEDGQTILKLFKHQHLVFNSIFLRVAFPGIFDVWRLKAILNKEQKNRHKRQEFLFASCALAEGSLKEETGLIHLCLHPNPHFKRDIKLIDAWGIPHHFDLSRTEFALQKRVDPFLPSLCKLLKNGQKEEVRLAIDALLDQMRRRCQMGIADRDPNLLINFGLIDGKAIEFDLGSYYSKPELSTPFATRKELFLSTHLLQKWLEKDSPDLLDYLLKQIVKADAIFP